MNQRASIRRAAPNVLIYFWSFFIKRIVHLKANIAAIRFTNKPIVAANSCEAISGKANGWSIVKVRKTGPEKKPMRSYIVKGALRDQ